MITEVKQNIYNNYNCTTKSQNGVYKWRIPKSLTGICLGLFLDLQNVRAPTVFSLFLLTSPHRLPRFFSLSSVRQLSSWHSHHLLRTRWISLLQKSFALCHSFHLPAYFSFFPFSPLLFFSSHTRSRFWSLHLHLFFVSLKSSLSILSLKTL